MAKLYPVVLNGPSYLKHRIGWLSEHEKPGIILDCIWRIKVLLDDQ
jgi:hypothetical protein